MTKKEIDKTVKIKTILNSERPIFQSIGIGINNNIFYFGTKVFDKNKLYDAVVTSDKKIYVNWKNHDEIKTKFKLNYRYPLYEDVLDYMWSNTGKYGIKKWLFEELNHIELKEVYEDVLKLFMWKYWYPDEKIYKHHALSLISNYFLPIFEMKGRELIYGETGFGKTRLSKIYQLLTYNPSMSMDWSDSSVFRTIESTKATIIIDNFDSVEDEKRKRILHLFNTGCTARQKAIRVEGKTFRPTGFNIFSNMILNSITTLDEVSENRSNITRTLKTMSPEFTKLEEKNPIWSEVRDKLYICTLQNFQEVQKTYEEIKEDKLVSRELERVAPILTIAKCISSELYDELIEFYIKDNQRRKIKDLKEDWSYLAIEKVVEKLGDQNEIELRIKDIVDELADEIFDVNSKNFDKKKHGMSVIIGSIFRNCILFPVRTLHGFPLYTFTREKLVQFCNLKDFGEEIIEKLNQKTLSHTPTLPFNSPNLPIQPILDNKGKLGKSEDEVGISDIKKPKKLKKSELSEKNQSLEFEEDEENE